MLHHQWFYKNRGNEKKVEALAKVLNISEANARLLVQRGVETFDEAKNFFRPKLEDLHNPYLMKDMDLAVRRLSDAIINNEKVLIYGDYDVDGTTSVALVYSFLKRFTRNIDFYIPDRYSEGYGVSYQSIDYAKEHQVKLIIALDCGIKAVGQVEYAQKLGIDYIICDHHLAGSELPQAVAVLDPKRPDCEYPDKDLSACGVGFKMIQAFAQKNKIDIRETYNLLDLVVVSIASDIVPIVGENRIMAFHGLKLLNGNPRIGLQSLIQVAVQDKEKELDISDIVFKIGPRINAAGRLKSGRNAVELLIEQDYSKAIESALSINQTNTERRDLDHQITEEALQMIESSEELIKRNTSVLFNPKWHKGVVGIVASRLIEHYYRPTIVLSESDGILTGSARSVAGFNVHEAIEACSEYLENYGGHMYAAGVSLKKENLENFVNAFEKVVSASISKDLLIPKIEIDLALEPEEINRKFFNIVRQMAPFGPGNMKPVFSMKQVRDNGDSRVVGKDASHLKLSVYKDDISQKIQGIAFGMANHYPNISRHKFAVCFCLQENVFNGTKSIQMDVKDIQIHQPSEKKN